MVGRTIVSCVLCLILFQAGSVPAGEAPAAAPKVISNSIGMQLILIPPGEFVMGSPDNEEYAGDDERPQHKVRITKPFYLGATEVTQDQYQRVMGDNPSWHYGDPLRPVESVSWHQARRFCQLLSDRDGRAYRLPTEAEWEYACRAGSAGKWCFGDEPSKLRKFG